MGSTESTKTGAEMLKFEVGNFVGVRCEVQDGPFSEERLVTIETVDGAITGFVRETELRERNGEWEVRGKVSGIFSDSVEVFIRGSFFTTNGLAKVPRNLAMAA